MNVDDIDRKALKYTSSNGIYFGCFEQASCITKEYQDIPLEVEAEKKGVQKTKIKWAGVHVPTEMIGEIRALVSKLLDVLPN